MEDDSVINCPNCETFIGETLGLDICPCCGCSLIGDWHKDLCEEEREE